MRSILRAAARLNFALRLDAGAAAPRPRDTATVRQGGDAAQVLLLGNGPATGWGVSTHRLALTGALGRALGEAGGGPVDVDHVGDETMNVASALNWLGDRPLMGYALAVVVIGMNDAMRLTRPWVWERELDRLLAALEAGLHPAARIVVAGIQPVRSVVPYDTIFGSLGQRRADRFNAITTRVAAARSRALFVAMPAAAPDVLRPFGSADTYTAWAQHIAVTAAPLLAAARSEIGGAAPVPDALDALPDGWRPVLEEPERHPGLHDLVQRAKAEFKVDAAMVTLMTGDRQYFAASTTTMPSSVPRELTYCTVTMEQDEPLVVPNARRDARFRDNPYLDLIHLPFYAGVPLHDADGTPIGTFCLFSALPKRAGRIDTDALGGFARLAEQQLDEATSSAARAEPARA